MGGLVLAWVSITPGCVSAHCDTLNGPVVQDARWALEKGDVTPTLKWIQPQYESEIREAFAKTLIVRKQSTEARELADRYFFETLVRIHREGEGELFTGLKDTAEIEPIIADADAALEKGTADSLLSELRTGLEKGVSDRFQRALESRRHRNENVAAGRRYVEAYVAFVHYAERLHMDLIGAAHNRADASVPQKPEHLHH